MSPPDGDSVRGHLAIINDVVYFIDGGNDMALETTSEDTVGEKFIFGNIHQENVVLPDLETGPEGARQAFRLEPGEVADLARYFDVSELKKSRSLDLAVNSGLIKPCKSLDEKITVVEKKLTSGIAPLNEFDIRLAEELKKEEEELDRLKQGRDGLASRVRDLDRVKK